MRSYFSLAASGHLRRTKQTRSAIEVRCRALHEEANPAEVRTLVQPAVLLQPRLARLPPRAADEGVLPRGATAGLPAVPVSYQDNICA